jgi:putative transcriptional regulator
VIPKIEHLLEKIQGFLTGKILVSMPFPLFREGFKQSIVYVCTNTEEGSIGFVMNRLVSDVTVNDLFEQLHFPIESIVKMPLFYGGPINPSKGVVLHSTEYKVDSTYFLSNMVSMTSDLNVLNDISNNKGPQQYLITLGYVVWGPGQLEKEIVDNSWLSMDFDPTMIFSSEPIEEMWINSFDRMGIKPENLSTSSGHA